MRMNRIYILLLALSLALMGCGGSATRQHLPEELSGVDVAYVKGGKLWFYELQSRTKGQLSAEKEEVYSCELSPTEDAIYYTVKRNGELALKRWAFGGKKAGEVEDLLKLKVSAEQPQDAGGGGGYMYFSTEGELVMLFDYSVNTDFDTGRFDTVLGYSPATGELRGLTQEDVYAIEPSKMVSSIRIPMEGIDSGISTLYGTVEDALMYRDACLTDELALQKGEDMERIDFGYASFSHDSTKLLFTLFTSEADIPYGLCYIADTDGKHQQQLSHDGSSARTEAQWIGQSNVLIFMGGIPTEEVQGGDNSTINCMAYDSNLCITNPEDNSVLMVDDGVSYWCAR